MNNFFRMIGLEHPITKIIAIILIFSFIFLLLGSIPVFKDLIPFLVTGGIGYWAYRHFFKHADDQVKEKRKKHLMIVMSAGAIFGAAMASLTQNPTIEETIGAAIFFAFITPFVWPVLHTLYHTFFVAKSRADQRLRGAQLVVEKIVLKMLDKVLFSSQIGNIPLPRDVETRGVLLAGAPGTGKSVAMIQMLQKFRERGDRAVIFDVSSQFLERFYRKGDIVFNPLDSRSPAWSPFAEIQDPRLDCDRFAKSLIPDGEGNGAEWNFFAQQTISAILKKLVLAGATTNHSFLSALAHSDLKDLAEMVKGTPAARLISEDAKGMTASILGVLGAYAAPFGILDPAAGEASFSLRKWMTQGEAGSWLFLTVKDDQSALLNPLISCWLDVLISSLLSLPPDQNRRVVFGLDEFATLPKIQSVHDLLSKGRKYGSVPLLGLQTIAQVRAKYGQHGAQTILSTLGTWLTLRTPDHETANYLSSFLGQEERKRITESESQSGSSSSESIQTTPIVMASELQMLKDREGFLSLAGSFPVCKTEVPLPQNSTKAAEAFQ